MKRNISMRKGKKEAAKRFARAAARHDRAIDEGRMFGAYIGSGRRGTSRRKYSSKRGPGSRLNPPTVRVRKSTGWIKAKAVRIERRGRQYVVKVKR